MTAPAEGGGVDRHTFAALYQSTLEHYVDSGHEFQLEAAYALGRQAFGDGMSILELVDLHRAAVDALMRKPWPFAETERIGETFAFLAEALATFEMTQRGYWEAQERARLDRDLSTARERLSHAYLTVDRAVDLPERLTTIEVVAADLVGARGARCYLLDDGGNGGHGGDTPHEVAPGHLVFSIPDPRGRQVALLDVDLTDRPPLADNDRFLLNEFSRMAGVAIENARLFARERATALKLQRDLLPATVPEVAGLDVALRYLPGEADSHAGGDWYDVFTLADDRVGLVVGDVTGHGVTAAAAMGRLRIAVLAYALSGNDPASVVQQVDSLLWQLATGEIATLVYVVVNPTDGELTMVNAGHPPPLVVEPDGSSRPLVGAHGRLLGVGPVPASRQLEVTRLALGGHLLLYTDGLIEPLERAGRDGVAELTKVTEGFDGTADELCDRVLAKLAPDGGRDDICIVAASLKPAV